jgi:hypothetical protein
MTSANFCYFLQGYLEIEDPKTINAKDLARIKGHLRLAFRDDIDPSMGDAEHQEKLNDIHTFSMNNGVGEHLSNLKPSERC